VGFRCDYPGINCEQCDKILAAEGIEPDCENCDLPVLSEANQEAWELYQTINSQFVYDFHALPLVFDVYGVRCTREEAKVLLEKLILIHGMISEDRLSDVQTTD